VFQEETTTVHKKAFYVYLYWIDETYLYQYSNLYRESNRRKIPSSCGSTHCTSFTWWFSVHYS